VAASAAESREDLKVDRLSGTVVWFNNGKGFGFVSHSNGPDVFCHFTSIQSEGYKSLKEGDKVEFSIVQGPKGPQTENVIVVAAD
jgi:cold shock protein